MSGWTFASPAAAWWLLLLPPLVLLYFLKLRRPRVQLASLVLWQMLLRDERVNSPFRRLRRNLLLWLQVIALLLLVLAAMQPVRSAGASDAGRLLVLIDRSASMGALDRAGGVARLEEARAQARALADGLAPRQEMGVIAFAATARLLCPFTSERRVLSRALQELQQTDERSDLEHALRLAAALATTTSVGRVLLLSDGNLPSETAFDLPFAVEYRRVAPGGANLGITRLHASRAGRGWSVLVVVEGNTDAAPPARLRLLQDGRQMHEEAVFARRDRPQRLVLALAAPDAVALEAVLVVDGFDALAADDHAYVWLVPPRPLQVRVAKQPLFEHALRAHDGVELVPSGPADLVVSAAPADLDEQAAVGVLIGAIPPPLADLVERSAHGSAVVDWQRSEPLLEHVEIADLVLLDRLAWRDERREGELERRGYEVLVHGDRGPLLVRKAVPRGRGQAYALLFDPDRSTLPYRVAFPILVANLVGIAMRAAGIREVECSRAGVLPPLQVEAPGAYTLRGPASAGEQRVESDAKLRVSGLLAERTGWYTLERSGQEGRRVGVSVLDSQESLLTAQERLRFRELSVGATKAAVAASRPWAPRLAALTFGLLCFEWWWFRRARRAPALEPVRHAEGFAAGRGVS